MPLKVYICLIALLVDSSEINHKLVEYPSIKLGCRIVATTSPLGVMAFEFLKFAVVFVYAEIHFEPDIQISLVQPCCLVCIRLVSLFCLSPLWNLTRSLQFSFGIDGGVSQDVDVADVEEWTLPLASGGTVLSLAKHIGPSSNSSVLYEDLANTIDGGENPTPESLAASLLEACGKTGGMEGVIVNATNPAYADPNYVDGGGRPEGIILKIVIRLRVQLSLYKRTIKTILHIC